MTKPNAPETTRAYIYARISEDRDGTSTAPERQIADSRAFCAAHGLDVAGVFEDRDLSASKPGVVRPGFEAVLAAAQLDGAVIVAWNQDRLLRQPVDAERVILAGVQVRTVGGDTGMLSDAQARLMVRIKAAIGAHESDMLSLRVSRKAREAAEAGKPHRGRRAFGHLADGATRHEVEAPIVRELVARTLAGERISALVASLN